MKRISAILDLFFLHPELDVETRWNSTYLMLKQLVEIQDITDRSDLDNESFENITTTIFKNINKVQTRWNSKYNSWKRLELKKIV